MRRTAFKIRVNSKNVPTELQSFLIIIRDFSTDKPVGSIAGNFSFN